jgi:hypothetical protein
MPLPPGVMGPDEQMAAPVVTVPPPLSADKACKLTVQASLLVGRSLAHLSTEQQQREVQTYLMANPSKQAAFFAEIQRIHASGGYHKSRKSKRKSKARKSRR